MKRRCPPYKLTRADLEILIAAGKTASQAAELTGWSRDYMHRQAWKMKLKFPREPNKGRHKRSPTDIHRLVVALWHQGLGYDEIAQRAGITWFSVKHHVYDARKRGEISGKFKRSVHPTRGVRDAALGGAGIADGGAAHP